MAIRETKVEMFGNGPLTAGDLRGFVSAMNDAGLPDHVGVLWRSGAVMDAKLKVEFVETIDDTRTEPPPIRPASRLVCGSLYNSKVHGLLACNRDPHEIGAEHRASFVGGGAVSWFGSGPAA